MRWHSAFGSTPGALCKPLLSHRIPPNHCPSASKCPWRMASSTIHSTYALGACLSSMLQAGRPRLICAQLTPFSRHFSYFLTNRYAGAQGFRKSLQELWELPGSQATRRCLSALSSLLGPISVYLPGQASANITLSLYSATTSFPIVDSAFDCAKIALGTAMNGSLSSVTRPTIPSSVLGLRGPGAPPPILSPTSRRPAAA